MMRLILLTLAMLYGFWDLLPAQPPAPRAKAIYAYFGNGVRYLSSVKVKAYYVPPTDSVQFVTNTYNGAVYSTLIPMDSSSSSTDGKVSIKIPLTSDLAPSGTRARLVYTYQGRTLFDTQNLPTPNLALTDTTTICLQKATGATTSCP